MTIASCDIGLSGGITIITDDSINIYPMPTITVIDRPPVTIFARDASKKKVIIKSGPNKGTFKKIIKTPAKTHKELDCISIYNLIAGANQLVIETPGTSFGNAASSTAKVNLNYGKILAIAELLLIAIVPIPPHVWKGSKTSPEGRIGLNLGRDKSVAITYAEELLSDSNKVSNLTTFKATQDGLAESLLIGYYYNKELL